MFDVDDLNTFIDRKSGQEAKGARPEASGGYPAEAPKSREERLRDFYDKRQPAEQASSSRAVAPAAKAPPSPEAEAEALKVKKQGNDLYQAREYESAVEHYTTAIKLAPSAVLHSNRAAAYMMMGWWDQALRDTRVALRKDPGNARALERQGKIQVALDNLDEAKKVADQLVEKLPEAERSKKVLPDNIRRVYWLAEKAKDPSTLEDVKEVLAALNDKAELTSPLGTRLRKKQANLLVERSDAVDHQRKIRPAMARNKRTEEDGDEIQEITPYAEEAVRITGELLEDFPDDADIRYWRGRALVRLGRHEDAEAQFRRGLKDNPDHQQMKELVKTINELEDMKSQGNNLYKEGKLNEAIHYYTMAIDKDPDCTDTISVATLHYNRSAAFRRKGEFQQALDDVNTALALRPKWTKALYRRGILLLECGRAAEALTELKVVQRADPTFDDDLEDWLRRAHNWLTKRADEKNYYELMKIPMDSSKDDIKKQYKRLCLAWHPDKNPTEEGRARFEDLQEHYKFLMNDEGREKYDFGQWKDKQVRHHVKTRTKVKDTWDDSVNWDDTRAKPMHWGDRHLIEDDKVESVHWGDQGCPEWLKEQRRDAYRKRYGVDPPDPP